MKNFLQHFALILPGLFSFFCSCGQVPAPNKRMAAPSVTTSTEERAFEGGSVKIPSNWKFFQSGNCSELSFISWDPVRPARQFFYYGVGGVFYLSAQQKQMDANYVAMGGMRSPLIGNPVINPTTPDNFVRNFHLIAEIQQAKTGQKLPEMYNVQVISVVPQPSGMPNTPATAALVRAVFTDRNKQQLSEGVFLVTVVPINLTSYGPGANFGVAYSFMGITAPLNELDAVFPPLYTCMQSFTLDNTYANNCIKIADQSTAGILKAGKTLSEASDNMIKSWQNRKPAEDIISQKRSDAIMGRERLYNPDTKEVYEVDNTFTDKYNREPQKFNYNNLQKLPPDDHRLWTQPTLNGADHIKRIN